MIYAVYPEDSVNTYKRSRRAYGNGQYTGVVDLLVIIDHQVYREAYQQYGNYKTALVKMKKYYTMLVSLVSIHYVVTLSVTFKCFI